MKPSSSWHESLAVFSTWVVGLLHLGFLKGTGKNLLQITIANFTLFKARWACSVLHWYDHLAIIFFPSIGLEDIIAHI